MEVILESVGGIGEIFIEFIHVERAVVKPFVPVDGGRGVGEIGIGGVG